VRAGLLKQRIESLQIFNTLLQGGAVTFGEGTVVKHSTEGWGRAFRSNARDQSPRHDLALVIGLGAGEGAGNFASAC
jgi:hypothetical protein